MKRTTVFIEGTKENLREYTTDYILVDKTNLRQAKNEEGELIDKYILDGKSLIPNVDVFKRPYRVKTLRELVEEFGDKVQIKRSDVSENVVLISVEVNGYHFDLRYLNKIWETPETHSESWDKIFLTELEENI